jgi:hypothetical protein
MCFDTWGNWCVDMSRISGLLLNSTPPHTNTCVESSKHFSTPVSSRSSAVLNLSTNEGKEHMVGKQSWDERNSRKRERQFNDTIEPESSYRILGPQQDLLVEQGVFGIKQKVKIGICLTGFQCG